MASVPTTRPPDGFKPWWIMPPAFDAQLVTYWRFGMTEPNHVSYPDIPPWWNVYGAWWAPASALSAPITKAIN